MDTSAFLNPNTFTENCRIILEQHYHVFWDDAHSHDSVMQEQTRVLHDLYNKSCGHFVIAYDSMQSPGVELAEEDRDGEDGFKEVAADAKQASFFDSCSMTTMELNQVLRNTKSIETILSDMKTGLAKSLTKNPNIGTISHNIEGDDIEYHQLICPLNPEVDADFYPAYTKFLEAVLIPFIQRLLVKFTLKDMAILLRPLKNSTIHNQVVDCVNAVLHSANLPHADILGQLDSATT